MDYIESKTEQRHAMDPMTMTRVETTTGMRPRAKTWCNRWVTGLATGGTIAPGITCEQCRMAMRKEGWLV